MEDRAAPPCPVLPVGALSAGSEASETSGAELALVIVDSDAARGGGLSDLCRAGDSDAYRDGDPNAALRSFGGRGRTYVYAVCLFGVCVQDS